MKVETTKQIVEEVLRENKETRDDDFLLCLNVYVKMCFAKKLPMGILISYKNIENAPAFETITRIRREIQNNEQRLKASEEVEERRKQRQVETSNFYSSKPRKYTEMKNSHLSW